MRMKCGTTALAPVVLKDRRSASPAAGGRVATPRMQEVATGESHSSRFGAVGARDGFGDVPPTRDDARRRDLAARHRDTVSRHCAAPP